MFLLWKNTALNVAILLLYFASTGYGKPCRSGLLPTLVEGNGLCVCVTAGTVNGRASPNAIGRLSGTVYKDECFTLLRYTDSLNKLNWSKLKGQSNQDLWVPSQFLTSDGATTTVSCLPECADVTMVTRKEWDARTPRDWGSMTTPVDLVFIHHTSGAHCDNPEDCVAVVQGVQNYHMDDRGWWDGGYSFFIGGDGRAYTMRGWQRTGAHTYGYNTKSIGIALLGDFMNTTVPEVMLTAVQNLIQCGVQQGFITADYSLHGHRDARCTTCPGDTLYDIIDDWPQFHVQTLDPPTCG